MVIGNVKYQSLEHNELDEKDEKDNMIDIVILEVKKRNPKGITNYAIQLPENIFEEIAKDLEKQEI